MPDNKKIPEFSTPTENGLELNPNTESEVGVEHIKLGDTVHNVELTDEVKHAEYVAHSDIGEPELSVPAQEDVSTIDSAPPKEIIEKMLVDDVKPSTEYDSYEAMLDFSTKPDEK